MKSPSISCYACYEVQNVLDSYIISLETGNHHNKTKLRTNSLINYPASANVIETAKNSQIANWKSKKFSSIHQ